MDTHLFLNCLIYLAAAAIAAPLGRRLGLGAVLGYLIVGAIIGPSATGLIGGDPEAVMHFAEFGVVLMLFVIGLEIDLSRLWKMRGPILGVGGLQVLFSTFALSAAAMLLRVDWREALAIGMILALSSTAIVMQNLRERGLNDASSGTQSFAVLLFQDIVVIPMIALLPLLASMPHPVADGDGHGAGVPWIDTLPAWSKGLVIVGAIALIVVVGRFLLTPWLRWVASLKVTEALTATTVALVVGIALLMDAVGLSPALGTFVAGVMLASSEYRHELESDIEPFKALLLAVFFLAVGASIDFALIAAQPLTIGLMVIALIGLKFVVLYGLGKFFGMSFDQRLLFAVALAQGGEFAFVLGSYAVLNGVIGQETAAQMIAAVALSMALAPPLLLLVQKVILPRLRTTEDGAQEARESDVENHHSRVLLVGFGRFGHPIIRLLRSAGHMPTVLERDSDHVEFVRRLGLKCYYGDATRPRLLKAAGAEDAELLVIAIDDEDECMGIIESSGKHFPHLKILARACSRDHAYRLHEEGIDFFIEQLGSSLDCAIATLVALGHEPDHAKDAARRFKEHELKAISDVAPHRGDEEMYVGIAAQNLKDLDSLLANAPLPVGGKAGSGE
ncbi:MAG: CPA2 family monovalent cation:H+ antiporter-2 [Verrucomicrobiales bacterium]|jgi:CPA2 family monovalent cation:H+ antiporter-2